MKEIKLIVWKKGTLNLIFWILGITIWLILIVYLFNIGNNYVNYIQIGIIVTGIIFILGIISRKIGLIKINKSKSQIDVSLKLPRESILASKVEYYDFWWNYNYTMFSGNGEIKEGGTALQLALWMNLVLSHNQFVTIREILPNWSSTPNNWNYNAKGYEQSNYQLSTIGLRSIKRKLTI